MESERMEERCLTGLSGQPSVADDEPVKKSSPDAPAAGSNGCFDCNICLDFAAEPVVTLCGHLYCWPCIYEWLQPAMEAAATDGATSPRRQCPVCKAAVSPDSLVPLYGRGGSSKKPGIPCRPTVHREAVEYQNMQSVQHSDDRNNHNVHPQPPLQPLPRMYHGNAADFDFDFDYPPSPMGRGLTHSTAGGVLGGMAVAVLPWAFRSQVPTSMFYSSPFFVAEHSMSPRMRRQRMEVERSLHQILFFLFVFAALCLLLF